MAVLVGQLLDDLGLAISVKGRAQLVDEVQNWAGVNAREARLTRETYNGYKERDQTEAHLAVALVIQEYLHAHSRFVRNATAAKRVNNACASILKRSRKQRFERSAGQEPSVDGTQVNRHSGAYVLFRMESNIGKLCQELIILSPGENKEKVRHATVVGRNLIVRGHWHLFGASLYLTGLGYRVGHEPDFLTISFAEADQVAGGVLTGLTTSRREPVTMSVIIVKLPNIDPSLFTAGDASDSKLISEFCAKVPRTMTPKELAFFSDIHQEVFGNKVVAQETWFEQKIITSSDRFVAAVRSRENLLRVISPGITAFCKQKRPLR